MAPDRHDASAPSTESPASPGFSFSTDWLPERDRLEFFTGEMSKLLVCDIDPLDQRPEHTMHVIQAGPVAFSSARFSPTRITRRRDHLKDCDESFLFFLTTGGFVEMTHNGREVTHRLGDAGLIHNSRPGVGFWPEGGSTLAVRVDGTALRALVREPEDMAGGLIESSQPGLALLRGYLRTFSRVKDTLTPGLAHSFGLHVVDLVAAVLGATRDGAAQAEAGGIRAARLRQVLDAINRACDPAFTVETIAGELGVSARYIQRILEESGSTFSEHVVEHRLRRARHLLCCAQGRPKVAEIAYEAGFNDLAHFHRVFRRRFGATPAAMRGAN